MDEYTYKDIFEEFGIMQATCSKRFSNLGIKRARRDRFTAVFNKEDVLKMIASVPKIIKQTPEHSFKQRLRRTSIEVIEAYVNTKDNSIRNIAELTGFSPNTVSRHIENWFKDGYVLVESKLNNMY